MSRVKPPSAAWPTDPHQVVMDSVSVNKWRRLVRRGEPAEDVLVARYAVAYARERKRRFERSSFVFGLALGAACGLAGIGLAIYFFSRAADARAMTSAALGALLLASSWLHGKGRETSRPPSGSTKNTCVARVLVDSRVAISRCISHALETQGVARPSRDSRQEGCSNARSNGCARRTARTSASSTKTPPILTCLLKSMRFSLA